MNSINIRIHFSAPKLKYYEKKFTINCFTFNAYFFKPYH